MGLPPWSGGGFLKKQEGLSLGIGYFLLLYTFGVNQKGDLFWEGCLTREGGNWDSYCVPFLKKTGRVKPEVRLFPAIRHLWGQPEGRFILGRLFNKSPLGEGERRELGFLLRTLSCFLSEKVYKQVLFISEYKCFQNMCWLVFVLPLCLLVAEQTACLW